MIPVFDRDHKILGYLDEMRVQRGRGDFQLMICEPMKLSFPLEKMPDVVQVTSVNFRWDRMRENRDERRYLLDVLITDGKFDDLVHIVGFKSFVSYHGKDVTSDYYFGRRFA